MARATTTKASARKPRTAAVAEPPKRKPGRPVGSTNAKKVAPPVPARATKPVRGVAAKSTPTAPKLNKAELEQQVIKLDRTLARLREKNKELKQAATDAKEHADALQEQLSARPPAAEEMKAPRKTRRGASKQPAPDMMDSSDEAEAEG